MTQFKIEINSDSVCPWCYVGHRKLNAAIAAYKSKHPDSNDTFSTTWLPFYLNPDAPKEGIDKTAYYRAKFGSDRTEMMFGRLAGIGKEVGINFKFGGKTGNTRNSHRLIQLGKSKSPAVQTRVVEELFAAYFENEQDITSMEVLRAAGVRAGIDQKEVDDWLNSDKGGKEVDEEVYDAKMQEITGVPHFTINDRYEIGGAQESAVFLALFEKIHARDVVQSPPSSNGGTCN